MKHNPISSPLVPSTLAFSMLLILAACSTESVEEGGVEDISAVPNVDAFESEDTLDDEDFDEMEMSQPMREPKQLDRDGVIYVGNEAAKFPLVRYLDGQVGASNSCAVKRQNKLSRSIPPAYVNGQPFGFC